MVRPVLVKDKDTPLHPVAVASISGQAALGFDSGS
jgi:hypothetical protein